MDSIYILVKGTHMSCAMLSISGFILRGIWMINGSNLLNKRVVKVLPHVVDTVFITSGIGLVAILGSEVLMQPWLLTKFTLLFVYIALGFTALSKNRAKPVKITAFLAAITVFSYIIGVAIMKSPASWFG